MNWKATLGLGVVLVVAVIVYFATRQDPVTPDVHKPWTRLQPGDVRRIELARKGEPVMVLMRAKDEAGAYWMLERPIMRPANDSIVGAMARNIVHLRGEGKIKPGTPEGNPEITGLEEPRLTVRFHGKGVTEVYRFGKEPRTQMGHLFFTQEGRDVIAFIPQATFLLYDKPLKEVRSPKLVRYEQYKAEKIELTERWEKGAPGRPAEVVYEKTVMEKQDVGTAQTWFMTEPRHENVDDLMVNQLVADLNSLPAVDFVAGGKEKERALEDGRFETEITVHLRGGRPITFRFGGVVPDRSRLYVKVDTTGETAVIERERFDKLLRRRADFRSKNLFPFTKAQVKTLRVEARGLGHVLLERREQRRTQGEEELVTVSWEVVEPGDVKVDRDRVEAFVDNILLHGVEEFFGEQPDLGLFNLDPPDARVTVETAEREYGFRFGLKTQKVAAFAFREGGDEVYGVPVPLLQHLRRLELNFRDAGMFDVRYDDLAFFGVEVRDKRVLGSAAYAMEKRGKAWAFTDPEYAKERPDMKRVRDLLSKLNYIQAQGFLSREVAARKHYKLVKEEAPTTVRIRVAGKEPREAVLYVSTNLGGRPGHATYVARFEGDDTIFKPDPLLVEALKRPPILGPDDEPEEDGHDHDHERRKAPPGGGEKK